MQKLTLTEIRRRYKDKYGKRLCTSSTVISQRVEEFQLCNDGSIYYFMIEDKEQDCNRIIDILYLYTILKFETDISKKYDMMVKTLSETYLCNFPKTVGLHKKFIFTALEKRKNKNKYMVNAFCAFRAFLPLLKKEIFLYSNLELIELMQSEKLLKGNKTIITSFIKYVYNFGTEKCNYDIEMTALHRKKIKEEKDFYTQYEWAALMNKFLDVDANLEKAYENCKYARYWLYVALHISLAWRKSDIMNIPGLDNLLDIDKYSIEWFKQNVFTITDGQKIINSIKLVAEQYSIQKTGARKHFNIPMAAVIPTAIAFIICEQWRRKENKNTIFNNMEIRISEMMEMFDINIYFSSLKANRTLLSFFNESISEDTGLSEKAGFFTSYMRAHAINDMGVADITTTYLYSTYDERQSVNVGKQIIDTGGFGWLYHKILELSGYGSRIFKQNTEMIAKIQNSIPVNKLEDISEMLYSLEKEKEYVLEQIYSWHEDEIKEKAKLLLSGKLFSKADDIYCVMGRCPYPTESNCIMCKYSIPTTYSLLLVGEELNKNLLILKQTGCGDELDRIKLTFQISKLISIIKDAIYEFGQPYVESFIDFQQINRQIEAEMPKMIFLKEE